MAQREVEMVSTGELSIGYTYDDSTLSISEVWTHHKLAREVKQRASISDGRRTELTVERETRTGRAITGKAVTLDSEGAFIMPWSVSIID